MTIEEMHFDFKMKLNKVDSQQTRNFLVPEIDHFLNEAQELFVKIVAEPRYKTKLGFETSQRNRDDIRTIVTLEEKLEVNDNVVTLPSAYNYFLKGEVLMEKGNCKNIKGKLFLRQIDDSFTNSPFDNSSFEWRTVNGLFFENGIKLFDDGTFTNKYLYLSYIQKLPYIHNAQYYRPTSATALDGTYTLPSGVVLSGSLDSPLPEQTHSEIVDIAVYLASSAMTPSITTNIQKMGLNQTI